MSFFMQEKKSVGGNGDFRAVARRMERLTPAHCVLRVLLIIAMCHCVYRIIKCIGETRVIVARAQ